MSSDAIGDALICMAATGATLQYLLRQEDFPSYAREWAGNLVDEIDEITPRLREKWRKAI